MQRIKIMTNGAPGNVAVNTAHHALEDSRFELLPYSLTGPEIDISSFRIDNLDIALILPDQRDDAIGEIKKRHGDFISIDFTHPSAVNDNAAFYCRYHLPFVMGTTGGDRELLSRTVEGSSIAAVIAPNMAKQIVGFQAMMEHAADHYPDLFKGYTLEVRESHQKGKADTSGTAKAMVSSFNKLGIPFSESEIIKERDPDSQKKTWGIPGEHLKGHAWHTYTLTSNDNTVNFVFQHNVNGRDIYARGTLDAVPFLFRRVNEGAGGKVFTMIDVLEG